MTTHAARGGTRWGAWMSRLRWACVLVPVAYAVGCAAVSHRYERGFATVVARASEQQLVQQMGPPALREPGDGAPFLRYADRPCMPPCRTRVWYENPWSLAGEAWSFELDANGRVLSKARWVSP